MSSDTAEERLKRTVFIVEADSYAQQHIWSDYADNSRNPINKDKVFKFEQMHGWLVHVGRFARHDIYVSMSWTKINGFLVMFYYPTSRIVDHNVVEAWLKKHFDGKYDGDRRAQCDASNAFHCLSYIDKLTKAKQETAVTVHFY
jgi:hypothetical protein